MNNMCKTSKYIYINNFRLQFFTIFIFISLMICGGIWFLSNQLCLFYPRALLRSRFLYCTTWYKYKKTNWQMDKPTTEGHICKTVRNARLTGFQTMYTIKSALDLVGSNMISIDLGSSSFTMVVKHSFVRYTWYRNYKLYLKVDLHLHCNHKLGYHCRTGQ